MKYFDISRNTLRLIALAALAGATSVSAEEYPAVDCVINPYQVVDLSTPISGVIGEVLVERSDYVTAGQIVARLDARVEKATVELAQARTKLEPQLRAEAINSEYDQQRKSRMDSLYGRKVVTVENKEEADRDSQLSYLRLQQVQDLEAVRHLELQRAKELLEQKTIRSSIDGFVVELFKSGGEYVEDQPIVRIVKLDPLNIEAIMPMKYFGIIHPGMTAEVQPELLAAEIRTATVTVVDRIGDAASGTFGVRLEMDNPEFTIPAGLKCDVKFLPPSVNMAAKTAKPAQPVTSATRHSATPAENPEMPTSDASRSSLAASAPAIDETPADIREATRYSLGPFADQTELAAARESVRGFPVRERKENVEVVIGFIVLTPVAPKLSQEDFIEKGIEHYQFMTKEPHAGKFSMGVYDTRKRAVTRKTDLQKLGIETEIATRTRERAQWWLDVVDGDLNRFPDRGDEVHLVQAQQPGD